MIMSHEDVIPEPLDRLPAPLSPPPACMLPRVVAPHPGPPEPGQLAAILVRAFFDDPAFTFIFPDAGRRTARMGA
jgi:hypothetical protein